MPTYTFKNKNTQEVVEERMSISAMETYLAENPDWEMYYGTPPAIGDSVRLGLRKTPQSFRELLGHMKKKNLRSTINDS